MYKKITVKSMISDSGNAIANQFVITTPMHKVFQSYNSVIAIKGFATGQIVLDRNTWDYSRTTGKYRNIFLGENTAETRKKIKSGEYKLKDLN